MPRNRYVQIIWILDSSMYKLIELFSFMLMLEYLSSVEFERNALLNCRFEKKLKLCWCLKEVKGKLAKEILQ